MDLAPQAIPVKICFEIYSSSDVKSEEYGCEAGKEFNIKPVGLRDTLSQEYAFSTWKYYG
jgi:hypothetical protein